MAINCQCLDFINSVHSFHWVTLLKNYFLEESDYVNGKLLDKMSF